jgi:hypothetical protein
MKILTAIIFSLILLAIPPQGAVIYGPTEGHPKTYIQVWIAITPVDVDPYTATVSITDHDPMYFEGEGSTDGFLKWIRIFLYFDTAGDKEIHVHAWNDYGSVTETHTITIEPYRVFIPTVVLLPGRAAVGP